jgi:hypothetical protein
MGHGWPHEMEDEAFNPPIAALPCHVILWRVGLDDVFEWLSCVQIVAMSCWNSSHCNLFFLTDASAELPCIQWTRAARPSTSSDKRFLLPKQMSFQQHPTSLPHYLTTY